MNLSTRVALVLLRLAIGWHFLFEGLEKVHSVYVGPTTTNKPFSAEGYFREANGPLGPLFRSQIGDPDQALLATIVPLPDPDNQEPGRAFAAERMPPALSKAWDAYADRLIAHYRLSPDQRDLLAKKLVQLKDSYVNWLRTTEKDVTRKFPAGDVEIKQKLEDRVKEYQDKVNAITQTIDKQFYAFGAPVDVAKLRELKSEAKVMRDELSKEVAEQTSQAEAALQAAVEQSLTPEQRGIDPMPTASTTPPIEWINFMTRWGLVVVGACLLLGLFSRLAALAAAAFLAMVYLTVPPLPWLPSPPNLEGHYLYVNKTLVEMLALLTLVTVPSGMWFGLDYSLAKLNPFRRQPEASSAVTK